MIWRNTLLRQCFKKWQALESAELRYNRSHAAPFQRQGAPPKIMPQSDISFHNTANCESTDLLIGQSNSGLGIRYKHLTTPESADFILLTLTPLPTPPSLSELSNLFTLYQIIKHEKIQAVFPNVETILRLFLCLMVANCSGERSFSKLKRINSMLRLAMSQERLSDLSIPCVENELRLIEFDDTVEEFTARKARRKIFWQLITYLPYLHTRLP